MTLNTDNRLMSDTTMTREFEAAAETFGLSLDDFEKITINAMKSAFLPYDQRCRLIYYGHKAWIREDPGRFVVKLRLKLVILSGVAASRMRSSYAVEGPLPAPRFRRISSKQYPSPRSAGTDDRGPSTPGCAQDDTFAGMEFDARNYSASFLLCQVSRRADPISTRPPHNPIHTPTAPHPNLKHKK